MLNERGLKEALVEKKISEALNDDISINKVTNYCSQETPLITCT